MDVPDPVKRMINELAVPKWIGEIFRTQLESTFKNDFTLCVHKRSGEVIFPGMNKDEQLNIAIALDTPGSISKEMPVTHRSTGYYGSYNSYKVTIMQFDTNVYGVEESHSDDGRTMSDYKLQGGGGTDFDAVYNYMELNDTNQILVNATDGYLGRVGVIRLL